MLVYPAETDYRESSSGYRELFLPGKAFADLFAGFVNDYFLPEYCTGEKAALL